MEKFVEEMAEGITSIFTEEDDDKLMEYLEEVTPEDCDWIIQREDNYTLDGVLTAAMTCNGKVLVGIVCAPGKTYFACKTKGAFVHTSSGTKKLMVDDKGVVLFGVSQNPYNKDDDFELARTYRRKGVKCIGPTSWDICRVAEGTARMFMEFDVNDVEAASLILSEAGGKMYERNNLSIFYGSAI